MQQINLVEKAFIDIFEGARRKLNNQVDISQTILDLPSGPPMSLHYRYSEDNNDEGNCRNKGVKNGNRIFPESKPDNFLASFEHDGYLWLLKIPLVDAQTREKKSNFIQEQYRFRRKLAKSLTIDGNDEVSKDLIFSNENDLSNLNIPMNLNQIEEFSKFQYLPLSFTPIMQKIYIGPNLSYQNACFYGDIPGLPFPLNNIESMVVLLEENENSDKSCSWLFKINYDDLLYTSKPKEPHESYAPAKTMKQNDDYLSILSQRERSSLPFSLNAADISNGKVYDEKEDIGISLLDIMSSGNIAKRKIPTMAGASLAVTGTRGISCLWSSPSVFMILDMEDDDEESSDDREEELDDYAMEDDEAISVDTGEKGKQ